MPVLQPEESKESNSEARHENHGAFLLEACLYMTCTPLPAQTFLIISTEKPGMTSGKHIEVSVSSSGQLIGQAAFCHQISRSEKIMAQSETKTHWRNSL